MAQITSTAMLEDFDRMEREELEREAVEETLAKLAKKFVESDEINDRADEARVALRGITPMSLADVVGALEPLQETFELRTFGIHGFDHAKVQANLAAFLRDALAPAARLHLDESGKWPEPRGEADFVTTDTGGYPADDEMFETLEDANRGGGVLALAPGPTSGREHVLEDTLAAGGDLETTRLRIKALLENAQRDFDLLRQHGARVPSMDAVRFRDALTVAGECVEKATWPKPTRDFVGADVSEGVMKAFRLVGAGDLEGSVDAGDILARIVLELAGLVPRSLTQDDSTRAEYTRKARQRAEARAKRRRKR